MNFLLPVAVVFLAQPYNWWSRFTMLILAAGLIGLAYFIHHAPSRIETPLKAATLFAVLVGLWFCTAKIDNGFTAPGVLKRLVLPTERAKLDLAVYGSAFDVARRARGARIGVDTSSRFFGGGPRIWYFYPLFGSRFDHHVYPLRGMNQRGFLSYLKRRRIDYVVIGRSGRFSKLGKDAARMGCLRLASESDFPPARAYHVMRRCPGGAPG